MNSDNLDTMTAADKTALRLRLNPDPLGVDDEEPWRWVCPDCGASLPREDIGAHRQDEELRSMGAVVWMLGAIAVAAAIALVVVIARWPE